MLVVMLVSTGQPAQSISPVVSGSLWQPGCHSPDSPGSTEISRPWLPP